MAASAAPFTADTGSASASQQKRTGVVNRILLDGTNQDAYQIILIMGQACLGCSSSCSIRSHRCFNKLPRHPDGIAGQLATRISLAC